MSGKKAGQVSNLLSKGEQTRKVSTDNFNEVLSSCEKEVNSLNSKLDEIKIESLNIKCEFSTEALSEFGSETKMVLTQFNNINIDDNGGGGCSSKLDSIKKENKKLNGELNILDKQAEVLRSSIRYKNDYCDAEYRQAQGIKSEYDKIATHRNALAEKAKQVKSLATLDFQNANSKLQARKNLLKQVEQINQKAKDIVALREKASDIKQFVDKSISEINIDNAKKFMPNALNDILQISSKLNTMNDNEVVSNFSKIEENISLFKNELLVKKEAFEKEKAQTLSSIDENNKLLVFDKYYNPLQYSKDPENTKPIDLTEFMTSYVDGQYLSEIKDGLMKAKVSFDKEDFATSQKISADVRVIIENAIAYANIKQENLLKNIMLATDIRNVMIGLNYKAKTSFIDDNLANGIRVTCTIGDEIIDFEKIYIEDDGNVVMDIDHTESVTGTCGTRWEDLQKTFLENDILLQDVKKNGSSILARNKTSQIEQNNQQQRSR